MEWKRLMTDQMHQPPAEIVKNAHATAETYAAMYAASSPIPRLSGPSTGKRIDWIKPFTKVKNTSFDYHNVSIKWFEDGKLNVSANCIDRHLATRAKPDRDHLGKRRPGRQRAYLLSGALRAGFEIRQRAAFARREEGRPGHPLSADDPAGGLCHARLRADRRGAFHRLRRIFGRRAEGAHRRLRREAGDHRGRGAARRTAHAAQGQCRPRARGAERRAAARCAPHRRRRGLERRARRLAARGDGARHRPLRAGGR